MQLIPIRHAADWLQRNPGFGLRYTHLRGFLTPHRLTV